MLCCERRLCKAIYLSIYIFPLSVFGFSFFSSFVDFTFGIFTLPTVMICMIDLYTHACVLFLHMISTPTRHLINRVVSICLSILFCTFRQCFIYYRHTHTHSYLTFIVSKKTVDAHICLYISFSQLFFITPPPHLYHQH